jgi:uncharacterized protein (DUF427 family)
VYVANAGAGGSNYTGFELGSVYLPAGAMPAGVAVKCAGSPIDGFARPANRSGRGRGPIAQKLVPQRNGDTMAQLHPMPPFDDLTYYPIARWVRGTHGGVTVIDSRRAVLVWEPGTTTPIYAFPADDVSVGSIGDADALELRHFDDPDLAGYVTVPWDAMERWYEEDEEVFVHPRDPFVRVDALHSSRHVQVERDGRLLADSDKPIVVFETGRPTRYYMPESDVDGSLLADSDLQTGCPYKGLASYRHVLLDGRRYPNLFWYYDAPFGQVADLKGYLAPYSERVDLIVDGEVQDRPAGPLGRRAAPVKPAA